MYRKILVPFDGSEPAGRALEHAVNLARADENRPEVILLHVISVYPDYHLIERPASSIKTGEKTTVSKYLTEVYEVMELDARDVLATKKEEIRKSTGIEVRTVVLTGHVADTIREFAQKENVDLLVIGNVGRTGVSKIRTLGSVSRRVAETAPCPVMIVH